MTVLAGDPSDAPRGPGIRGVDSVLGRGRSRSARRGSTPADCCERPPSGFLGDDQYKGADDASSDVMIEAAVEDAETIPVPGFRSIIRSRWLTRPRCEASTTAGAPGSVSGAALRRFCTLTVAAALHRVAPQSGRPTCRHRLAVVVSDIPRLVSQAASDRVLLLTTARPAETSSPARCTGRICNQRRDNRLADGASPARDSSAPG